MVDSIFEIKTLRMTILLVDAVAMVGLLLGFLSVLVNLKPGEPYETNLQQGFC
jgi:hypothetical protein